MTAKLKIEADGRALKTIEKDAARAFDPKVLKLWENQAKSMTSRVKALEAEQRKLVRQMVNVKRGTDEYKKLESQLKKVEEQAARSRGAVTALNDASARVRGSGSGGGGGTSVATIAAGGFAGGFMGSFAMGALKGVAAPIRGAVQTYQDYLGYQQARLGAAPSLGSWGQAAGRGRRFGLGPAAEVASFDALNRAAGGMGGQAGPGFSQALAMQNVLGIGLGETGGLMRGFRSGMGAMGGQGAMLGELEAAIGSGMIAGLSDLEIGDSLRNISSLTQQVAQKGQRIDVSSVAALSAGIGNAVGSGVRGGRLMASLTAGIKEMGFQGPQGGAMEMAALRAAGWSGSGSITGALERMQRFGQDANADAEFLTRYLESEGTTFRPGTVGRGEQARQVQRAFLQLGGSRLDVDEARKVARVMESGNLEAFLKTDEGGGILAKMGGGKLGETKGLSREVTFEAERQARRVSVGRSMSEGARNLQDAGLKLIEAVKESGGAEMFNTLTEGLNDAVDGLKEFTAALKEAKDAKVKGLVDDAKKAKEEGAFEASKEQPVKPLSKIPGDY